jgi:hypothetical protein
MAINVSRVLTGGLLAGLIIIASGMLMVPVVGPQMDAALKARNVPPLGGAAMAFVAIWSVVLGVLLVWLYAAVRPRFGPGPKTAAIVSLVVWCLAYLGANASLVAYGFLPVPLTVVGTVWGLVELVVAGQVGARLYRET